MLRLRANPLLCMLVLLTGGTRGQTWDDFLPSSDLGGKYHGQFYRHLPLVVLSSILLYVLLRLLSAIDCRGNRLTVSGRSVFDPDDRSRGSDGHPRSAIASGLPTLAYSVVKERRNARPVPECEICLGEFEDNEEILRLIPKCGHLFHAECIDTWLLHNATCPLCRAKVTTAESAGRWGDSLRELRTEPATRERLDPPNSTNDHVVVDVIS